ncbi:unnamed protein product [Ascophyllum nodosum]
MLQALQDATRAAARFARRHRRAIVVGGVVGATAYAYYGMRKAIRKAEEEHEALVLQAGEEARYRLCLARTRGECLAALENFIPALRKRLFMAVDVIGPVRELKALRGGGGSGRSRTGASAAVADGPAAAEADLETREVELWEKARKEGPKGRDVKVTALTRLVVALYTFNALALMLHVQLHILGRLSFEESLENLRRTETPCSSFSPRENSWNLRPSSGPAPSRRAATKKGGIALSMQARHALLSSTYEYVLEEGLRGLVKDVELAVARCTSSWHAHTRQEVGFQDLVAVLRRVRREIEGSGGGTRRFDEATVDVGGVDPSVTAREEQLGRASGARHSQLLRYIINPSDGIINGEAIPSSASATAGDGGENRYSMEPAGRASDGVEEVLDETWDTAESPNFAAALQSSLDTTFAMVFEKIQQKAFSPRVVGAVSGGSRGEGATTPGVEQAAAAVGDGSGPEAAAAGAGRGAVGDVAEEGTERLQVLATVISQAKLVVSDILEPSSRENQYTQAVAALPTVQELCFSVFSSNRNLTLPPLPQRQPRPQPQPR